MAFKSYKYVSDDNDSFLIRLDTRNATVTGAVEGAADFPFHVDATLGRREFGLHPRHITARRAVGTSPNEKIYTTRLPICTSAAFDALNVGGDVSINGVSYKVATKVPEFGR